VRTIVRAREGTVPAAVQTRLDDDTEDGRRSLASDFGVFMNEDTLEVDLFADDDLRSHVIETLREGPFGQPRMARINEWEADPASLDSERFLAMVETIGKGRFAQRLVARLNAEAPPDYIRDAIAFLSERV
jgi:putative ATP-dependent endonuclease of OLD family